MVDYNYYKGVYGGVSINDAIQFKRLAWAAEVTLNNYIHVNIKDIEDVEILNEINMLICYIADSNALIESTNGVKVSKVDNVSVTYRDDLENVYSIESMINNSLKGFGILTSELDEAPIYIGYVYSRKRC